MAGHQRWRGTKGGGTPKVAGHQRWRGTRVIIDVDTWDDLSLTPPRLWLGSVPATGITVMGMGGASRSPHRPPSREHWDDLSLTPPRSRSAPFRQPGHPWISNLGLGRSETNKLAKNPGCRNGAASGGVRL